MKVKFFYEPNFCTAMKLSLRRTLVQLSVLRHSEDNSKGLCAELSVAICSNKKAFYKWDCHSFANKQSYE